MKLKFTKYDKLWSLLVRTRDKFTCQVCRKKSEYVHAHHYVRRGVKPTRLMVENGITLCAQCHTFNHNFSAHKTPEAFKAWFKKTFPACAKAVESKAKMYLSEREAIKEFIEKYDQKTNDIS